MIKIYDNRRRKTIKATKFLHSKFLTRSKFKKIWQGLNLAKRILDMHKFELFYSYLDEKIILL
ncbi:hypothetical protein [Campylobacter sputorum]|uniref:hypothetical protein n=1 Tax=Campylobacter sputorum TaxID=206 RepID=UPI0013747E05|nr:hypothetical protein [Campylobacter sputorum]